MRLVCTLLWVFLVCCVCEHVQGTLSSQKQVKSQNAVTAIDISRQDNKVTTQNKDKKKRKSTRRERCCHLGRRMAKIGEKCEYVTTLASLRPDYEHYHKLKTKVWVTAAERPQIKLRFLRKCKRFKAFYEKCCSYEARLIDQDLKRMFKRLRKFFRKNRKGRKRSKIDKTIVAGKAKSTV